MSEYVDPHDQQFVELKAEAERLGMGLDAEAQQRERMFEQDRARLERQEQQRQAERERTEDMYERQHQEFMVALDRIATALEHLAGIEGRGY